MSDWYIVFYDEDDNSYRRSHHGSYAEAYAIAAGELARGVYEFADLFEDETDNYACTVDMFGNVHFDNEQDSIRRYA